MDEAGLMGIGQQGRKLRIFLSQSVHQALSQWRDADIPDVVLDAVEGYFDAARAGRAPRTRAPGREDVQVEIPLSPDVDALLRRVVLEQSDAGTRADVLRAALEDHLGSDSSAPRLAREVVEERMISDESRRITPSPMVLSGPSDDVQGLAFAREGALGAYLPPRKGRPGRPALDDSARASRRARSRLQAFASSRWMVGSDLTVDDLLPPPVSDVPPLAPDAVSVGVGSAEAEECLGLLRTPAVGDPLPSDFPRPPLSGLVNRVAPTLWATARLVEMQLQTDARSVRYGDFIARVMPLAWDVGLGLQEWELINGVGRRSFVSSARWPTIAFDAPPDVRERREASTVLGFMDHSLIIFRGPRPGALSGAFGTGPMESLGLVDVFADRPADRVRAPGPSMSLSVRPAAVELLRDLAQVSTSCQYPHNPDAWACYRRYLASECPAELDAMRVMLRLVAESGSRRELSAASLNLFEPDLPAGSPEAKKATSSPKVATGVSGLIARLREWGLMVLKPAAHGPDALTELGNEELTT